jgi:hypothetical protein
MMVFPSFEEVESFTLPEQSTKNSAWLLPLDKQHGRFRVNGCGLNLIQPVQGSVGRLQNNVLPGPGR